jgi:hypothetical protein
MPPPSPSTRGLLAPAATRAPPLLLLAGLLLLLFVGLLAVPGADAADAWSVAAHAGAAGIIGSTDGPRLSPLRLPRPAS